MRGDHLAVQAEGQQRPLSQLRQCLIHETPAEVLAARPRLPVAKTPGQPGILQQVPADPGSRQHSHHLHHPAACARLVTGPDRVQGEQHRPGNAMRVGLSLVLGQVLTGTGSARSRSKYVEYGRCCAAITAAACASASGR